MYGISVHHIHDYHINIILTTDQY